MSLASKIIAKAEEALRFKTAYLLHVVKPPIVVHDQGVNFHFKEYDVKLLTSISKPPQKYAIDPLLPPYEPHLFVARLSTMDVIINKFMHQPGHVVLTATNPTCAQGNPLLPGNFDDMAEVLNSFGKGITYYNSGIDSGCTQLHKHAQYTPLEETPILTAIKNGIKLPFECRWEKMDKITGQTINDVYHQLVKNLPTKDYNFIVRKDMAALFPRTMARHPTGVVVNSLGMCGVFSVWHDSNKYIKEHPMQILTDLSVSVKNE
ncbi:hypothetical protein TVAG_313020 [Trichomonas vaginalis G3]|uniref:Uncharacterized protein n=1 Tax=Trichomonas vaginalis (strain ATCC PRA-98 / G3) TaxID=412133 RepID=A2FUK8_TRIV3|nr:AP-4-A phosphorylase II family [Trichomonas vaginalis G3]EAX91415.1 hypothetical protein TVAG_313020 [Trichomonas vaginalis G3]KAI5540972.1 AP-4-A phosphorylase II family [Trichomonas vaginalis G3]|eukprot:XP_001304345.1 hypothetical protein [Trichomonas vaginalis G3]